MGLAKYETVTVSAQTTITLLTGYAFAETAGTTATVTLKDGGSSGAVINQINLAANESVRDDFSAPIKTTVGPIYVTVSGTQTGALYGS